MLPFDDYIPSCTLTIVYSRIPMFYLKSKLILSHAQRPFSRSLSYRSVFVECVWLHSIPNIERMRMYCCANLKNKVILLRYR